MAKKCFVCGEMAIKKVKNKNIEKILTRLVVAENVKEFYMLTEGAFAAAVANAVEQMQSIVSGVRLHAASAAPDTADVVLCPYTRERAQRDPEIAALLQAAVPPRLICLGD